MAIAAISFLILALLVFSVTTPQAGDHGQE
jgi:hypothetical protein